MLVGNRDHMAHGHRAARRKPDGASVRMVIVLLRRSDHPFAGGLIHLGIAIQRARDRRRRQSKPMGEILEVHGNAALNAVWARTLATVIPCVKA